MCGTPDIDPVPVTGGSHQRGVLSPLLSSGSNLCVSWSTSIDSPYFMEPCYWTGSRLWGDGLLERGNYSEYLHERYVWTSGPPPGIPKPVWDPFLGEVPMPQPLAPTQSLRPPLGRAEWLKMNMSMRGLVPWAPQVAPAIHQPPPSRMSLPATPYQQVVWPLSRTSGLRVTFDSSATKPAPSGSPDTDVRGRQARRG